MHRSVKVVSFQSSLVFIYQYEQHTHTIIKYIYWYYSLSVRIMEIPPCAVRNSLTVALSVWEGFFLNEEIKYKFNLSQYSNNINTWALTTYEYNEPFLMIYNAFNSYASKYIWV